MYTPSNHSFNHLLPLLFLDEYFAEFEMQKKDDLLVLENSDNEPAKNLEQMFEVAKKEGATVHQNGREYSIILPEAYLDMLEFTIQEGKKEVQKQTMNDVLLDANLLSDSQRQVVDIQTAVNKFNVFRNVTLVNDILKSLLPVFSNAKLENCTEVYQHPDMDPAQAQHFPNLGIAKIKTDPSNAKLVKPLMRLCAISDDVESTASLTLTAANVGTDTVTFMIKKVYYYIFQELLLILEELKKTTVSMFRRPSIKVFMGLQQAFQNMKEAPELSKKVFPAYSDGEENGIVSYKETMSSEMPSLFQSPDQPFDPKQKEAIYAITRPVNTTFVLFGPPGTGKTYTLVESIRQIFSQHPDKKILVCAPSNMASDAISLAILQRHFIDTSDIYRLMSKGQNVRSRNTKLDSITQYEAVEGPQGQLLGRVYHIPTLIELIQKRIIICTLGLTVTLYTEGIGKNHFSHIFIDEAAQSTEMESWLPIGLFAGKKTRVVLAGDPKQLGPLTPYCLSETTFKISMLARIYGLPYFKNDRRNMVQLVDNHRSHENIVKIFSNMFYQGTVISALPKGYDSLCNVGILSNKKFPVLFHSISEGTEKSGENRSYMNEKEVQMVMDYLAIVRDEYKVAEKDIGIIAPYIHHGNAIRARLQSDSEIAVGSVEKFQGSEKRVIIFSTVRTGGGLGFMEDELRFNTAISRAKHLLIVLGNEQTLNSNEMWRNFINICKSNSSFTDFAGIRKIIVGSSMNQSKF